MSSVERPEGAVDDADLDGDEPLEGDDDELEDEYDEDDEDVEDDDEDDDEDDLDDDDDDLDDDDDDEDDDEDEDEDDLDEDEDEEGGYEPGDVNAVDTAPYEAGDVNTISSPSGRADQEAGAARGDMPVAVLDYLARAMTDDSDAVVIRKEERRGSTILRLHVAPGDMGRVIGRRGRTAQAIRTLVAVAAARDGVQTVVDIVDD